MTMFEDIEFKCALNHKKSCNDCDECIICYNCVFLQKRKDDLKVKCKLKGEVDIHSTCDLYRKSGDIDD